MFLKIEHVDSLKHNKIFLVNILNMLAILHFFQPHRLKNFQNTPNSQVAQSE